MKKRIAVLLCTLSALLSVAVFPALAAKTHYPVSVEEYTYGPLDEPRINKVYQLSLLDDPSGIPTEDFERNGRRYYLLDLTRQDDVGMDTQPYTETVTMDSDTGELSAVLKKLDGEMEVTTEDGHTGTLVLNHTSVKVEVKGYRTSTRTLSATRTYPSLSDADLSPIPKTVTDGGSTLTLADVQWASGGDGTSYTATAFTEVVPALYYAGDHPGTLKIPSLGVNVKIYEGMDSAQLAKGAGHFPGTRGWKLLLRGTQLARAENCLICKSSRRQKLHRCTVQSN